MWITQWSYIPLLKKMWNWNGRPRPPAFDRLSCRNQMQAIICPVYEDIRSYSEWIHFWILDIKLWHLWVWSWHTVNGNVLRCEAPCLSYASPAPSPNVKVVEGQKESYPKHDLSMFNPSFPSLSYLTCTISGTTGWCRGLEFIWGSAALLILIPCTVVFVLVSAYGQ